MNTKVDIIKDQAVEKLNLDNTNDYMLVELKSDNGKICSGFDKKLLI